MISPALSPTTDARFERVSDLFEGVFAGDATPHRAMYRVTATNVVTHPQFQLPLCYRYP